MLFIPGLLGYPPVAFANHAVSIEVEVGLEAFAVVGALQAPALVHTVHQPQGVPVAVCVGLEVSLHLADSLSGNLAVRDDVAAHQVVAAVVVGKLQQIAANLD